MMGKPTLLTLVSDFFWCKSWEVLRAAQVSNENHLELMRRLVNIYRVTLKMFESLVGLKGLINYNLLNKQNNKLESQNGLI